MKDARRRKGSAFNIVALLKACAKEKDLDKGSKLHAYIEEHECLGKSYIASALVNMYASCGALAKAQQVLNTLPTRDVVSWTTLIAGYAHHGQGQEALECFDRMQAEGHSPNVVTFTCALKACQSIRAATKGEEIHEKVAALGLLEKHIELGSTLVDTYVRCGALAKAQQVFNELPVRDVVSWTALIAGYAQLGQGAEALKCLDRMEFEGHTPDAVTFICALKACGSIGAAAKGEQIHDRIISLGMLKNNISLGNSLVGMYARCDKLTKAMQVLAELPARNLVTWTVLIAGYVQQGRGEEALKCFHSMQEEGHFPDVVTFTCALKACMIINATAYGQKIHEEIVSLGMLERNVVLGSTLVDMYARFGVLGKAQQVLEGLHIRDVVMWTVLIAGYAQQGKVQDAFKCFDRMQREGHSPNAVTFMCVLQACGSIGACTKGKQVHDMIVIFGMLQENIMLASAVVDMYAKCGAFSKAQHVLEELPVRDVVTWNALIAEYTQQGQWEEALKSFDSLQLDGQSPDVVSFTCALKACAAIATLSKGQQIHGKIVCLSMLEKNIMLGNTLVEMYIRCGALFMAQQVLEVLPVRDVVVCNALVAGYAQQEQGEEALKCFDRMQYEGHSPDMVTFIHVLKACGSIGALDKGASIHEMIVILGLLEKHAALGTSLVDMYARCGSLGKAQQVLEELPVRDVITWTALLTGYAQQGQGEEALKCFDKMQQEGLSPNAISFTCALKACGSIGAAGKGKQIHDKIVSLDMLQKNIVLGNSLVDMYARCGALAKAQQVLEGLFIRDVVTWNALIAGYVRQGEGEEALKCFDSLQHEGHIPNVVTFTCALQACGSIGAVGKGEQIHDEIVRLGMLEKNIALGNTLVDMYVKCAAVAKGVGVFKELGVTNVITWNALIGGYAQQGQCAEVLNCLKRMLYDGVKPDSTTVICVLNACSHSGLLDEAEMVFTRMSTKHTPDVEQFCCMVDLFARAGKFDKAFTMIENMPSSDYLPVWHALLSACFQCDDVTVGRLAFEHALNSDKSNAAAYVCMANIYTAASMQDDADKTKIMRVS